VNCTDRDTPDMLRVVVECPVAIELEVFAYELSADFNRFLQVREELLLRIASVVEAAGSGFAPTRFISMQGGGSCAWEPPGRGCPEGSTGGATPAATKLAISPAP